MDKKGLCATCVHLSGCILRKNAPVWQCEEFSTGDPAARPAGKVKLRRVFSCSEATESE